MKHFYKKLFIVFLLLIIFILPSNEIISALSKMEWVCVGGNQERTFNLDTSLNFPLSKKWQLWSERVVDYTVLDDYMFVFFSNGTISRFNVTSGQLIDKRKPISGSFAIAMNHNPILKEFGLKGGIYPLVAPKVTYTIYFVEYESGILYSYSYYQDEIKWSCKLVSEEDLYLPRYYYLTYKNEYLYVSIGYNRIAKIERESGKILWLTYLINEQAEGSFLFPSYQYETFSLNEVDGRIIFTFSTLYTIPTWIIDADKGNIINMFEVGMEGFCKKDYSFVCATNFCYTADFRKMYALALDKIYEIDFSNSMISQEILSLSKDFGLYISPPALNGSYTYLTLDGNILSILIFEEKDPIRREPAKIHFLNVNLENKILLSHAIFNAIPSASVRSIFGIKGIEKYDKSLIIIERSGVYEIDDESGLKELCLFESPVHIYEQTNPCFRGKDFFYVYHSGDITSFNLKELKTVWEISVGAEEIVEEGIFYSDGIVYCKTDDDSAILAIDAETGKQLWKAQLRREISNNILITDQYIIAGNIDKALPFVHDNHGSETSIWLINKKTGKIYWEIKSSEFTKGDPYDTGRKGLQAPPILSNGNVYFILDYQLYKLPLSPIKNINSIKPISDNSSEAILKSCPKLLLADDRKAYLLAENRIFSIENNDKLSRERFQLSRPESMITSVCLDKDSLFVAGYLDEPMPESMHIYKIGRNLDKIWSVSLCKEIENCPITLMNLSLDDKNIYVNFRGFGKISTGIVCIDKSNGKIRWKKDIEYLDFSKIIRDENLYVPFCEKFPLTLEPVSIKNALIITSQKSLKEKNNRKEFFLSFIDKENGREIYNLSLPSILPTSTIIMNSFMPIDVVYKDSSRLKGLLFQTSCGNLIFYEEHNN